MRLMFASDIHGSLPAAERVLERFAQSGAQWLIILGDVLNHGPRNALLRATRRLKLPGSSMALRRALLPYAATAIAKSIRCCWTFPSPRPGSRF